MLKCTDRTQCFIDYSIVGTCADSLDHVLGDAHTSPQQGEWPGGEAGYLWM